tara:strand:- start:61 stop:276 length:216 start_codon:yes stop_codon:yes gene_type:complete
MKTKNGLTFKEKGTGVKIKGREVMRVNVYTKQEIEAINQRKKDVRKQVVVALVLVTYIASATYFLTKFINL